MDRMMYHNESSAGTSMRLVIDAVQRSKVALSMRALIPSNGLFSRAWNGKTLVRLYIGVGE